MAAGPATKDSIFVLQAHDIDIAEIQKVRSPPVRSQVTFGQLESYARWVAISCFCIVDRQRQQIYRTVFRTKSPTQVGCERSDSTLSWKIVPNDGDSARKRRSRLHRRECWCLLLNGEGTKIDAGHGLYWGHCLGQRHSISYLLATPTNSRKREGNTRFLRNMTVL